MSADFGHLTPLRGRGWRGADKSHVIAEVGEGVHADAECQLAAERNFRGTS